MFIDLCMLDELAMRLRVAGTYALEFGNGLLDSDEFEV